MNTIISLAFNKSSYGFLFLNSKQKDEQGSKKVRNRFFDGKLSRDGDSLVSKTWHSG